MLSGVTRHLGPTAPADIHTKGSTMIEKTASVHWEGLGKNERRLGDVRVLSERQSINNLSAARRGGLRSHQGAGGRTLLQLRYEARQRGLKGRSSMNKLQPEQALTR